MAAAINSSAAGASARPLSRWRHTMPTTNQAGSAWLGAQNSKVVCDEYCTVVPHHSMCWPQTGHRPVSMR